MVKPQRELSSSLYPRRFFKVFLPHQSTRRMKFPTVFIKYLKSTVPNFKSTIITLNKSSWEVHVEKIDDNLYFNKGWEQFVKNNSLAFGDFLVFSYDGNTTFCVQIYGGNGCEKKSTCQNEESCQVLSLRNENQINENGDSKGLDFVAISQKYKEGNKYFKEASEFDSDFPFFRVVMVSSFRKYGYLPASFVNSHLSHLSKNIKIMTLVYSEKSWPVKSIIVKRISRRFSGGWNKFWRDNELKAGDTCIFELIDSSNYVFKVYIYRCLS